MMFKRAFTLLELLMVVFTIAVLAAIAVPNFLEAQLRTQVARAQSDQASMVVALRAYYTDHRRYPPNNPDAAAFLRACALADDSGRRLPFLATPEGAGIPWMGREPEKNKDEFGRPQGTVYPKWQRTANGSGTSQTEVWPAFNSSISDLGVLTTPVGYHTTALPLDGFRSQVEKHPNGFPYVNLADIWRELGVNESGFANPRFMLLSPGPDRTWLHKDRESFNPAKRPVQYDPTNGTISSGNIFHGGE